MTKIGKNTIHLVRKNKRNEIVETISFTQDFRPAFNIDKKYVEINKMEGCIWYNDYKYFNTKEEGNAFYKECIQSGFVKSDRDTVDNFIHKCGMLTY